MPESTPESTTPDPESTLEPTEPPGSYFTSMIIRMSALLSMLITFWALFLPVLTIMCMYTYHM